MKFIYSEAKQNKYNDCVVRAIANAEDFSNGTLAKRAKDSDVVYDNVVKFTKKLGITNPLDYVKRDTAMKVEKKLGYTVIPVNRYIDVGALERLSFEKHHGIIVSMFDKPRAKDKHGHHTFIQQGNVHDSENHFLGQNRKWVNYVAFKK